jgi:hypothetical protein
VDLEGQAKNHQLGWPGQVAELRAGKLSENTENPLNAMSLADGGAALTEEERVLIQGEGQRWRADAPTCRRCPKPACRCRSACSASATTCVRR